MPAYLVGTSDPTISPDPGAGAWSGTPLDATTFSQKMAIEAILPAANVYPGDDAVKHMRHYLNNSGADLTIDLRGMVEEVSSAKTLYEHEIESAKRFAESLPVGVHDITSAQAVGGYNQKSESANWFFAIGGYSAWGKGTVIVSLTNGARSYRMIFRYKFFDRYNWDGGKSVTILGIEITDQAMGEFHRQGLAKEFDCHGQMETLVVWGAPVPVPAPAGPFAPPPPPLPPAPSAPATPPKPVPATIPSSPPKPPVAPVPGSAAQVHTVKSGDNLSMISKKYYGTSNQWQKIYQANKTLIGPNPNLIHPGQHLVIP